MAKKKIKANKNEPTEYDSIFFLKIVLYFVLGCLWVRFGGESSNIILPIGLLIGVIFATHEHFQIDRKIELAILLMATILSYIAPIGFVLNIG